MKLAPSGIVLMLLLATTTAQAQLYKWVGADGKVTYSDAPPPKSATRVEQKNLGESTADTSNLPYELAQAARNHPVTLYAAPKCVPCDDGRSLLSKRGIPFREKTVTTNDDFARLKQAAGETRLPVLTIGRNKHAGYEAGAWGAGLSAAGYPETSKLPKTYRNPAAEAAAPKPSADQAAQNRPERGAATEQPATDAPRAAGNAPSGFRF